MNKQTEKQASDTSARTSGSVSYRLHGLNTMGAWIAIRPFSDELQDIIDMEKDYRSEMHRIGWTDFAIIKRTTTDEVVPNSALH